MKYAPRRSPSPSLIISIVALVIACAGTAFAANLITSGDIKNGTIKPKDLSAKAKKSLVGAPGPKGEKGDPGAPGPPGPSALDASTIPSGKTITGASFEREEREDGGGPPSVSLIFGIDFNGFRAPAPLTDADINFDDVGISAAAAAPGEESSGCTGGLGIPTAPPGEVCIYLFHESAYDNTAVAGRLGAPSGFNQADDKGFVLSATGPGVSTLGGTWAYTAP